MTYSPTPAPFLSKVSFRRKFLVWTCSILLPLSYWKILFQNSLSKFCLHFEIKISSVKGVLKRLVAAEKIHTITNCGTDSSSPCSFRARTHTQTHKVTDTSANEPARGTMNLESRIFPLQTCSSALQRFIACKLCACAVRIAYMPETAHIQGAPKNGLGTWHGLTQRQFVSNISLKKLTQAKYIAQSESMLSKLNKGYG